MIQIRYGIFETNSSSANVLIIPKNQSIHIPKRFFFMDDDTSLKPTEIVLTNIIHGWRSDCNTIDQIINFLYNCGVEEIIYCKNDYFADAIEKYKDNFIDMGIPTGWTKDMLTYALFGLDSEINHYSDGEDRPTRGPAPDYKYQTEDDNNWYKEYSNLE